MTISSVKATALFLALLCVCGCVRSGGDGSAVDPPLVPRNNRAPNLSSTHLWWIWDVNFDPGNRDFELLTDRTMAFTCNATHFIEGPPLELKIKLVDFYDDGTTAYLTSDVMIKNPFDDNLYPGFDVMAVFMGDGSDEIPGLPGFNVQSETDQRLLNPDGYTRWYNHPEFSGAGSIWKMFGYNAVDMGVHSYIPSAVLNPYKYFADGLGETDNPYDFIRMHEMNRGIFEEQTENSRRFEIAYPSTEPLRFKLAIIAHWNRNDNHPDPPDTIFDFPPAANVDETLLCNFDDNSTVYYISDTESGGNIRLDISPWDWTASLIGNEVDEYEIRCYSDAFDSPVVLPKTPVYSAFKYHTFRTAIPVMSVVSQEPIQVWVEVAYTDLDYSNNYGVPNDASGVLANYFLTEVEVHDFRPMWMNVVQPNGGEELEVGGSYEIQWDSENLDGNIFIMYSLDDFVADFHPVAVNEPNDGIHTWENIPDKVSENVKIRVSSMLNSSVNDISDDYFTIVDNTEPYIRVVKPNGGEMWKSGTSREIRWVSKNVHSNVFIEYSKDNFVADLNIIAIDIENSGLYIWEDIPFDISDTVRVRISSMAQPSIFDISDADFTIDDPPIEIFSPDGGEEWKAGSDHEILWETIDFSDTLKIEYSKDYFTTDFNLIAEVVEDTGSFLWENIPQDPTTTARVRLSATSDPSVRDMSDDNFSIEESGWGVIFGGTGNENATDIGVDSSGNIYVTGMFKGTNVDFDADPVETDLHSAVGGMDVFLCKYNSMADFEWALTWGGTYYDRAYGVDIDSGGNIVVTGYFRGTNVDFDPGEGPLERDQHSSAGSYDAFVSKFDQSGEFIWADTFGGPEEENAFDVATDQFGNIYVTGSFMGTSDFDPGDSEDGHTASGLTDIFLVALDENGDYIWGRHWGGYFENVSEDQGYAVEVGDFGDIYVTGNLSGEDVDMDPDPVLEAWVTTLEGGDAFLSMFDLAGNFGWAGIWGGDLQDAGTGLATDNDGHVYVTGRYEGMVDFDPGFGSEVYISHGEGYDPFLSKLDVLGNHMWTRVWGGDSYNDYGWSVCVGASGTVYVIGNFEGEVDFDPTSGVEIYIANGDSDLFLSSFNSSGWYNWARVWGGDGVMDYGYGVYADLNGNAYITGGLSGYAVDLEPGDPETLVDTQNSDIFIIKVMPDGEW